MLTNSLAISSAIGAVAGGQMYQTIPAGWDAVVWYVIAAHLYVNLH